MQSDDLIQSALEKGQPALSECESKKLLTLYGIPVAKEISSRSAEEAAPSDIGFPVELKVCSLELIHKSERGCIELNSESEGDFHEV